MSYYPRDHQADDVEDFDDYDPTPYGGGYDIVLTYGRPLPPSEETCYPNTSSSNEDLDYDRPQYTSEAEPSAYADEALEDEYKSYSRPPNRRPQSTPQPNYGFQPGGEGSEEPGFGSGYGRKPSYGEEEGDGSGYGRKPNYGGGGEDEGGRYGSGRKPSYGEEEGGGGYGSGYGRKPSYGEEEGGGGYGSGYGRKPNYGEEEGGGDRYGSGYGRKPSYGEEEGGGGYGRKPSYGEEEEGQGGERYGSGYGRRTENEESRYGEERPSYVQPDQERPEVGDQYGRPSYGRPGYGRNEEGEYGRPTYERRDEDDESQGRKKYVSAFFTFFQSLFVSLFLENWIGTGLMDQCLRLG